MPAIQAEEESPLLGHHSSINQRRNSGSPDHLPADQPRDNPDSTDNTRHDQSRYRRAILCLLSVVFLEFFTFVNHVHGAFETFFNIRGRGTRTFWEEFGPMAVVLVLLVYILPMAIGLYADIYAGRYRTLLFGMGVKVTGSVLSFVVAIVYASVKTMDISINRVLFAIVVISFVTNLTGTLVVVVVMLTFAAQQGGSTYYDVSSPLRWIISLALIGNYLNNRLPFSSDRNPLFMIDRYGFMCAGDVLSIIIFLCGRQQYQEEPEQDGKTSWNELTRIIKSCVFCSKAPQVDDDNILQDPETRMFQYIYRRKLDRLQMRKGFLFFCLLSCFAVTIGGAFLLTQVLHFFGHPGFRKVPGSIVRNCGIFIFVFGVPIVDIVFKKCGHCIRPDLTVNQLKTIGVGSVLAILSLIITGIIVIEHRETGTCTIYCMIPSFLIMGLAMLFFFPAVITLCYTVNLDKTLHVFNRTLHVFLATATVYSCYT